MGAWYSSVSRAPGAKRGSNLKHLLEDIRDSYTMPLADTIIVEIIANALDSRPSEIRLFTDPADGSLTIVDDGKGMSHADFQQYHDIAATTKVRGKGIGFAGVGAKLSLLVGKVVTETRTAGHHAASEWWLETDQRAPWREVSPKNRVASPSGTAVSIASQNERALTDEGFVRQTVLRRYYPLVDPEFGLILNEVYSRPIRVYVNNIQVVKEPSFPGRRMFLVKRGRRRRPVGFGFIAQAAQ